MDEKDLFASISWPKHPTITTLAGTIAESAGFRSVTIEPIPPTLSRAELSGMAVPVGETVKIYYDAGLSPINREQTILHEFAHILLGDVHATQACTHHRTTFDNPREQRAELIGMRLMLELQRRGKRQSAVMNFITGGPEGS